MNERLEPRPGFAIVCRVVYKSSEDQDKAERVDKYDLSPGEGIIFLGEDDSPDEIIRFKQSGMDGVLKNISPDRLQIIFLVEQNTGNLFITNLNREESYGISSKVPKADRLITAQYGRLTFAGIWDESRDEAYAHFRILQKQRSEMN